LKKLKIRHFIQEPSHCAVATTAMVSNYYNPDVTYDLAKKIIIDNKVVKTTNEGLADGEIGLSLNYMGFKKVTFVMSDLNCFDYRWAKLSKNKLLEKMKEARNKINVDDREQIRPLYRWLKKKKFDNKIIIDYNFGKYIRKFLNDNKPVIIAFNWNMFFRCSKEKNNGREDDIRGDWKYHSVIIYGYNKNRAFICDSHEEYYKYKLKRFRKGFYTISWENLMTIMGIGHIFLPDNYDKDSIKK